MAIDPVCGMEVDEKTALSGVKDGKTWYFCNPGCRDTFLGKGPGVEAAAPAAGGRSLTLKVEGMH
jgi:YHS domain-containing protein